MNRILLTGAVLLFFSCQQKNGKEGFEVSGAIKNGKGQKIYLQQMGGPGTTNIVMDSAILEDEKGTFKLHGNAGAEDIFSIALASKQYIFFINDAGKIRVDADANDIRNFTVSGSKATNSLNSFFKKLGEKVQAIDAFNANYSAMQSSGASDTALLMAKQQVQAAISNANNYVLDYLDTVKSPAAAVTVFDIAVRNLTNEETATTLKSVTDRLVERFPTYSQLKIKKVQFDQLYAQQVGRIKPGQQAPDITMNDTQGKPFSLSQLRGKYVLVDFWASWCAPCRAENPNVVKAYNQYKDKNFTILGVSLDKEKDSWLKAIQEDGLAWQQISDLKYWNSVAVDLYHFDAIPYNVLVGPDGKVVADNLRGEALQNKLKELLK